MSKIKMNNRKIDPKAIVKERQKAKKKILNTRISSKLSEKQLEKAAKLEKNFLDKGYNDKISALVAIDRVKKGET